MKRTAILLAILLILSTAIAFAADNEETYQHGVNELTRFLQADETASPDTAAADFEALGDYKGSDLLARYCKVLAALKNGDFSSRDMKDSLAFLKNSTEFSALLEEDIWKDSPVKSAAVLEYYVNGRIAEACGSLSSAESLYKQCGDFMDAADRLKGMYEKDYQRAMDYMMKGKWAEAKAFFELLPADLYPNVSVFIETCKTQIVPRKDRSEYKNDMTASNDAEESQNPWSEWDPKPVAASTNRQIETKTETRTVTVYHYARYHYPQTARYNAAKGTYTKSDWTYASKATKTYVIGKDKEERLGAWEQIDLVGYKADRVSGNWMIDGEIWYANGNEEMECTVTLYRYRDK